MYPGGIADKFGNQYEAKFLVHKLLDVLIGEFEWIRFEGIEKEYKGFEFAVGKGNASQWFQTKINAPHGNWTINALKVQGVLDAFAKRLDIDQNSTCYFVSQNSANDLFVLSEKARISNNPDEYIGSLSKENRLKFTDLLNTWAVDKDIAFSRLKRSYFEVYPERSIVSLISVRAKLIFSEWGDDTYALLRGYMESNLNKVITTELIREHLREKQVGFKDWNLDPTLKEKIAAQTKRYLNTYSPFGAGGVKINRKEANELIEEIDKEKGARVVLLTGVAGSGKSGIIRAIVEHLKEKEIVHLAFRVDQHLDCQTPEKIGLELLERNESPVITLHGVSQSRPSVLIVDQVDAISEVSGRKGAVKNAILEFLDGLRALNTKIILVCRDFDLDNDSRLKALEGRDQTKRIKVGLLDWEEEIGPVFKEKNIDTARFMEGQKRLLTLPLNLSLYFEVGEENLEFHNREDLFDALWKKKEREIIDRKVSWSISEPLSTLATWMSEQQKLSAPSYLLDDFSQSLNILSSEGLIVQQEKTVNFFHESFFDYVYARTFLKSQQSITELLLSTEQHLFRRTQVRQILEVLRQGDRARYLTELEGLFKTSKTCSWVKKTVEALPKPVKSLKPLVGFKDIKIRYHIRIAIAKWLGSFKDPVDQERQIGLSLDTSAKGFSNLARSILLGSAGWFDVHAPSAWLISMLNGSDEQKKNAVLWWLLRIAHERPEGVASILREWWGGRTERAIELLQHSRQITTKGAGDEIEPIETLFCDLIDSEPEGLFSDSTAHNRDFILNTWVNENARRGSKVLKAYLNYWFKAHPGDHPFSRGHFSDMDMHSLSEAAQKNPSEFVLGFLDALNRSIDVIQQRKSNGEWVGTFESIQAKEGYGADKLIQLLREAFKEIAKTDPDLASEYLESLDPQKHTVFVHLHLETISANPEHLKENFIVLLGYDNLLKAGFHGVEWKSFADAAREVMPYLNNSDRNNIEEIIKSHKPELNQALELIHRSEEISENHKKWILQDLKNSGYEQWCILETMGTEFLSDAMKMFFNQLKRKFIGQKICEAEKGMTVRAVRSPISLEHAKFMSDQQWLRAIEKYSSNGDREYLLDRFIGGSEELARVLMECTKQDTNRFSRFLLKIPTDANAYYVRNVLYGLRESENCSLENLHAAIDYADQYPDNKPFGQEISHLITQYPHVCKEKKYFDLLIWYARNGTANDNVVLPQEQKTKEEITTIEDVITRMDHLYTSGINDVRGSAVRALSRVYWEFSDYSEAIESFLKERIEQEPLTSVRCVLIDLLFPFYNYDREKCGKFLEQLVKQNPDKEKSNAILTFHTGIRLLQYILRNVPESGKNLVSLLIDAEDRKTRMIGAWLAFGASYQKEEYTKLHNSLIKKGIEYKRLAAQVAADFFSVAEFRDKAIKHIMRFFNDIDNHVRNNAERVFIRIKPNEIDQNRNLIAAYLNSKAFSGDTNNFLQLLKDAQSDVNEYVIRSVERIFDDVRNADIAQQHRYRDYFYLEELLQREYAASESNPKLRKRYLDIIDTMLELEMDGSEKIVRTHDRHY